jgi:hypothetical protein
MYVLRYTGAFVVEWLRSFTSNLLTLTTVDSDPDRDFGFFECEESIQLAYYGMLVEHVRGNYFTL